MTTPPYHRERTIAELAVLRACAVTKRVLAAVDHIAKTDSSPVTVADFAAQALIISAVRAAFPHDGFVGEEDASALRADPALRNSVFDLVSSIDAGHGPHLFADHAGPAAPGPASVDDMLDIIDLGAKGTGGSTGRFWCMDPVDGTRSFLRGEQYAVSLALVEDGREVVGVLGCPNVKLADGRIEETSVDPDGLGIMLTAVRGQGSTSRHLPARGLVPPAVPLARLRAPADPRRIHVVDSLLSKAYDHDVVRRVAHRLGAPYPGTEVYSSHVRYAALIVGGGDFQLRVPVGPRTKMCVWDHAGAQLIFTELGGKVTDLDGNPIDFGAGRDLNRNRGMVAAKEDIHNTILELVRECMNTIET
ncbi:hypothetical protein S40285_05693 [Stachybotrys chlorohalonatus IBT 40285]|uniref:3'(2'),5'-bisphosphate nucleotidase n=1 Tax=Stachybotrys chlorohalonatus (strain IBT 40285) TaxID=1283841 RepID=A0A084QF12_STAC4|nr:hypothetical protein S40285_05693 [Stachybotrys chlorohalonata IBT 40285]